MGLYRNAQWLGFIRAFAALGRMFIFLLLLFDIVLFISNTRIIRQIHFNNFICRFTAVQRLSYEFLTRLFFYNYPFFSN